jgi:hypothetical protein
VVRIGPDNCPGNCNFASVLARALVRRSVPNRNGYYLYRMTIGKTKFAGWQEVDRPIKLTAFIGLALAS